MMLPYTFHQDLTLLPEIMPDSILSRAVYKDEHLRVTLFGFAAGQELSEHTSLHTLKDRGKDKEAYAQPGADAYLSWHM